MSEQEKLFQNLLTASRTVKAWLDESTFEQAFGVVIVVLNERGEVEELFGPYDKNTVEALEEVERLSASFPVSLSSYSFMVKPLVYRPAPPPPDGEG